MSRSLLSCALASVLCLPAVVTSCGKSNPLNDDDLPGSGGKAGASAGKGGSAGKGAGGKGGASGGKGGTAGRSAGGASGRGGASGGADAGGAGGEAGEPAGGEAGIGSGGGGSGGASGAGAGGAAGGAGASGSAGLSGASGMTAGGTSGGAGASGNAGTAGTGPVDPCNPGQVGLPVNVAVGKTATANKNPGTAGLAVDGDMDTLWTSGDDQLTNWWMVDLGEKFLLSGIRTTWEYGGVVYRYYVEVSSNGVNYTTVVDQTATNARTGTYYDDFPESTCARFVRVHMTEAEGYWMIFKEVEVEALLPE